MAFPRGRSQDGSYGAQRSRGFLLVRIGKGLFREMRYDRLTSFLTIFWAGVRVVQIGAYWARGRKEEQKSSQASPKRGDNQLGIS